MRHLAEVQIIQCELYTCELQDELLEQNFLPQFFSLLAYRNSLIFGDKLQENVVNFKLNCWTDLPLTFASLASYFACHRIH